MDLSLNCLSALQKGPFILFEENVATTYEGNVTFDRLLTSAFPGCVLISLDKFTSSWSPTAAKSSIKIIQYGNVFWQTHQFSLCSSSIPSSAGTLHSLDIITRGQHAVLKIVARSPSISWISITAATPWQMSAEEASNLLLTAQHKRESEYLSELHCNAQGLPHVLYGEK